MELENRKKQRFLFFSFLIVFFFSSAPLFSQGIMPAGMTGLMDQVLEIFTGSFVKTILIICLAGCAVAYGFNKDNEKMKRNIIAIGIAIAIVAMSSWIVGAVWDASKT